MVVDCLSKAASQQPTAIKEAEEQLRSWEPGEELVRDDDAAVAWGAREWRSPACAQLLGGSTTRVEHSSEITSVR